MAIQWDSLTIEMVLLAGIIWFSIYIEHWAFQRSIKKQDKKALENILRFIEDDLKHRNRFVNESLQRENYKPFLTDMWDAVIIAGKQSLLDFQLFQIIQRTYSRMKYYNSELEWIKKNNLDNKMLKELLDEVKESIEKALSKIHEYNNYQKS
jgi:ABC-type maltose transport system permease subunit